MASRPRRPSYIAEERVIESDGGNSLEGGSQYFLTDSKSTLDLKAFRVRFSAVRRLP